MPWVAAVALLPFSLVWFGLSLPACRPDPVRGEWAARFGSASVRTGCSPAAVRFLLPFLGRGGGWRNTAGSPEKKARGAACRSGPPGPGFLQRNGPGKPISKAGFNELLSRKPYISAVPGFSVSELCRRGGWPGAFHLSRRRGLQRWALPAGGAGCRRSRNQGGRGSGKTAGLSGEGTVSPISAPNRPRAFKARQGVAEKRPARPETWVSNFMIGF